MTVGAAVALNPDAAHIGQQYDRELPDRPVQPGQRELLAGDQIGGAQHLEPVPGHLADDPDGQPRSRERVPPDDLVRQPEGAADRPDLVLEQRPKRLDQGELQVLRQAADVVVRLDRRRNASVPPDSITSL